MPTAHQRIWLVTASWRGVGIIRYDFVLEYLETAAGEVPGHLTVRYIGPDGEETLLVDTERVEEMAELAAEIRNALERQRVVAAQAEQIRSAVSAQFEEALRGLTGTQPDLVQPANRFLQSVEAGDPAAPANYQTLVQTSATLSQAQMAIQTGTVAAFALMILSFGMVTI
jgi:hypothetical protein